MNEIVSQSGPSTKPRAAPLIPATAAGRTFLFVSLTTSALLVWWGIALRELVLAPEWTTAFLSLFLFQDYWIAILGVAVLLLSLLPPVQRAGIHVASIAGQHPRAGAALVFGVAALGTLTVYHNHPLSMDEYAAFFQARAFAAGRMVGEYPPALMDWLIPPQFQGAFFHASHESGKVASTYWPAFSLLMAPFAALGVPWLLNPLIVCASLLAVHRLACRLFGVEAAGLAALFCAASAAFLVNGMSYYSMSAHLLCGALYALLLLEPTPKGAFLAGVVGSIALTLHNPLPHMLFAIPWIIWLLTRTGRWRIMLALVAGYAPLSLLLGVGWILLAPTATAQAIADPAASHGFLVSAWNQLRSVIAYPDEALLFSRLISLAKVWLWAVPGLVILAAIGLSQARSKVQVRLLFWSGCCTLVGYLFIPFDQGHGWGYRYFHAAWFVLPVLAAGALVRRDSPAGVAGVEFRGELRRLAAACALLSLTLLSAVRFYQVERFIDRHLAQLPVTSSGTPIVVIVSPSMGYYAADLVQNDPFLRGPVTIMLTHGFARDREMMRTHFPELALLHRDHRGQVWGIAGTQETAR